MATESISSPAVTEVKPGVKLEQLEQDLVAVTLIQLRWLELFDKNADVCVALRLTVRTMNEALTIARVSR